MKSFAIALVMLVLGGTAQADQKNTYTFKGSVLDQHSGRAIPDLIVTIEVQYVYSFAFGNTKKGLFELTTVTDENGNYTISSEIDMGIRLSPVNASATAAGYWQYYYWASDGSSSGNNVADIHDFTITINPIYVLGF